LLTKTGELIQQNVNEIEMCREIIHSHVEIGARWDEIIKTIVAYQDSGMS
jgi:hypothetical protein